MEEVEMITLVPVPTTDVPTLEDMISPLIMRGVDIDGGRTTHEDVLETIESGDSQLWIVWSGNLEAIVITRIIDYDALKACSIDLCVGDNKKRWIHKIEEIEQWAKSLGCDVMEIPFARPGWGRVLPEYKKKRIVLVRNL